MPNKPITIGEPWGYCFTSPPTPQDSDYPIHTLAFTLAGEVFILIDNTENNAVWKNIASPTYEKAYVLAKKTQDQVIPYADNTVPIFEEIRSNIGDCYSIDTATFTAPREGVYIINSQLTFLPFIAESTGKTSTIRYWIWSSRDEYFEDVCSNANTTGSYIRSLNLNISLFCHKGDLIKINLDQNNKSGESLTIQGDYTSFLSIAEI